MTDKLTEGFDELDKLMKELGAAASGKALRQSVSFAVTPVLQQARKTAPKGSEAHRTYKGRLVAPGFLSRNINRKMFLSRTKNFASGSVAPMGEAWYGRLFSGTVPRPLKTKTGSRDFPTDDYLAEAFDAKREVMLQRFYQALAKNLDKARQRVRKK